MGGKLIQSLYNLPEKRLLKEQYFFFVERLISTFKVAMAAGFIPEMKIALINGHREKDSFGDTDIMLEDTGEKFDLPDFILEQYNVKCHKNGEVYSFPVDGFQVDINFIPSNIFQTALDYFNWSPAGNAVGKLCHTMKLRYGHQGLFYILREENVGGPPQDNSHVVESVFLTTDTHTIHDFIGLDYGRFLQGFDCEKDIFEWIGTSPYFNAERFSFEEMNHRARVRDKKRPDYRRLLLWAQENSHRLPQYQRHEDKALYLPMIIERFPILGERIEVHKVNYQAKEEAKLKFNGELVSEWTGLAAGKELGNVIAGFRQWVEKGHLDFLSFVKMGKPEEVKGVFMGWYQNNL